MNTTNINLGNIDPEQLFPFVEDASNLLILCAPEEFSASVICNAIEDCDAHVINLNVAADRTPEGDMAVYVRLNRRVAESAIRSLERFGLYAIALDADTETDGNACTDGNSGSDCNAYTDAGAGRRYLQFPGEGIRHPAEYEKGCRNGI